MARRTRVKEPKQTWSHLPWRPRAVAVTAGAAAALAYLAANLLGAPPWLGVAVALGLWVIVPSARSLSRRLAINGCLFLAWLPAVAWLPSRWLPISRMQVVVALVLGLLTGWLARSSAEGRRPLAVVVPRVGIPDLLIPATASVAAWVAHPLLFVSSPRHALSMLLMGWDNASHFGMYLEQRTAGAAPPFGGASPDASGWFFHWYPQSYHSLLTLLVELGGDPNLGAVGMELLRYSHAVGIVCVLLSAILASSLIQVAEVRASAVTACWSVFALWMVLLGVPGGQLLLGGHLSFLLSAAALAMIAILGLSESEGEPVVFVAALCGLLILTANWPLLLPAAVVACALCLRRPAMRRLSRRQVYGACAVTLAAMLWIVFIGETFLQVSPGSKLTTDGAIGRTSLASAFAVPLLPAVAVFLLRRTPNRLLRRYWPLAAISLVGVVSLLALGAYQLVIDGGLTYYFWKLSLGVEIAVLLAIIPLMARFLRSRGGQRCPRHPVSVGIVMCALSGLGLGTCAQETRIPSAFWPLVVPSIYQNAAKSEFPAAGILAAASSVTSREAVNTTLLVGNYARPSLPDEWFHALTVTRTVAAASPDAALSRAAKIAPNDGLLRTLVCNLERKGGRNAVVLDAESDLRVPLARSCDGRQVEYGR